MAETRIFFEAFRMSVQVRQSAVPQEFSGRCHQKVEGAMTGEKFNYHIFDGI